MGYIGIYAHNAAHAAKKFAESVNCSDQDIGASGSSWVARGVKAHHWGKGAHILTEISRISYTSGKTCNIYKIFGVLAVFLRRKDADYAQ